MYATIPNNNNTKLSQPITVISVTSCAGSIKHTTRP